MCQKFLINVLQITQRRIQTIQTKLALNQPIIDKRGSHGLQPVKMDSQVLTQLESCLKTIPSTPSHYSSTNRLYFLNSELDTNILYKLFLAYYKENKKNDLSICCATFRKYFKTYFNYGFKHPRIDICDFCYKIQINGLENLNQTDKQLYDTHLEKVKKYREFRSNILNNNSKTLVIEFD